jgi:hypothetical protein
LVNIDFGGTKAMAEPESKSETESKAASELPAVDSPPLSPGAEVPAVTAGEPVAAPRPVSASPAWRLRPRHKRLAMLAASVTMAAGLGAVVGAVAAGSLWSKPRTDVAAMQAKQTKQAVQERQALRQSLAHLTRQVATLKADLDKANKAAHSSVARVEKLGTRLDSVAALAKPAPAPETTGSIPRQPSTAAVPMPRPAPHIAAAESRPTLVPGWSVRGARGGYVYVEGNGDIFQVVPGARLPGVGMVQSVERQDGRWVVVTPRGLIVSMRDRRYFE